MQQYKRPEAIKRMNELAGSRKPFLFIIDYKQQCSLIEEISRIDSTRCRYNFNGVKNVDTVTESYSGRIDWNFVPMSLTDYRQAFEIVKRNILAGNSYLANLTCKVPVSTNLTLEDGDSRFHRKERLGCGMRTYRDLGCVERQGEWQENSCFQHPL